jgi:hypothetical protein
MTSLTPHQAKAAHEMIRKDMLLKFGTVEALHGKDYALVFAEATLEAIAIHLHGSIGPEKTYEKFEQRADAIGGILAGQAARHQ